MVELVIFSLGVVVGAGLLRMLSRAAESKSRSEAELPTETELPSEPELPAEPALPSEPEPRAEPQVRSEAAAASSGVEGVGRRWQPPYVSGSELFEWARSVSRGVVRDVVRDAPDAEKASTLVEDLRSGLGRAMLPDTAPAERVRPVPCPAVGQGTLGITAPEAIALAKWLRENLTPAELEELQDDVTLCEEWIGNAASGAPCALQGEDHVCMAFEARPFSCRPTLAQTLTRQLQAESDEPPMARSFGEVHVDEVTRGVIEGMKSSLERAGLDAKSYELHGALRRAMARPDAAEAWARGEDIFAKCRVIGVSGRPVDG